MENWSLFPFLLDGFARFRSCFRVFKAYSHDSFASPNLANAVHASLASNAWWRNSESLTNVESHDVQSPSYYGDCMLWIVHIARSIDFDSVLSTCDSYSISIVLLIMQLFPRSRRSLFSLPSFYSPCSRRSFYLEPFRFYSLSFLQYITSIQPFRSLASSIACGKATSARWIWPWQRASSRCSLASSSSSSFSASFSFRYVSKSLGGTL